MVRAVHWVLTRAGCFGSVLTPVRAITTKSIKKHAFRDIEEITMAAEFTTDAFETDVIGAGTPVLVDFWATWCGPCRQIAPVIDELAVKYEGRVSIGKVNVEEQPELAQRYGINAIPTLLLFKDGQIVERFQGVPPRRKLEAALDNA
jgi:thioredoxin 1